MIAYVGNASDCTHGLAIALADESSESSRMNWNKAGTTASAHTKVTGGTWRLPTIKDWQYMFIGCGASGSYSDNPSSMSSGELESKLRTAGGTAFAIENSTYWSGTEYDNLNSWRLYFESGNKSGTASFSPCPFNSWCRVRACLAF